MGDVKNNLLSWLKDPENLLFVALMAVCVTIPLSNKLSSICLLALSATWLMQFHIKNYRRLLSGGFGAPFLMYLLFVVGLLYTTDVKAGIFQLEQKLTLLVLPLILGTVPPLDPARVKQLLGAFVISCLALVLYGSGAAFIAVQRTEGAPQATLVSNQVLAGYVGIHSTYFSMYIAFSILIVFWLWRETSWSLWQRSWMALTILIFVIFLILLASRMVLLTCIGAVLVYLFMVMLGKSLRKRAVVFLLVVVTGIVFLIFQSSYLKNRFTEIGSFREENLVGSNEENGVTQRVFFWKNSLEIITKQPLTGYGTGDASLAFKERYNSLLDAHPEYPESVVKAIHFFADNNYNAHSQFLQIMIQFGIVGLVALLFLFAVLFFKGYSQKNFLIIGFFILVFMTCVTECVLDRQMGVVFYAFFYSVFLFHSPEAGRSRW